MKLFPKRSRKERHTETFGWVWAAVLCLGVAAVGLGLFYFGDIPGNDTWWDGARWIGLVVGVCAAYLFLQAMVHVVIEATIGPERFLAIMFVLFAIGGVMAALGIE